MVACWNTPAPPDQPFSRIRGTKAHFGGEVSNMGSNYESPRLTTVGSVKDLTLGQGWQGWEDTFVLHIGRFTITLPAPGQLS